MRYFKLEDRNGKVSIWLHRPDGMERCIYDSDIDNEYGDDFAEWYDPKQNHDVTMIEMERDPAGHVVKISKEDAILEAI